MFVASTTSVTFRFLFHRFTLFHNAQLPAALNALLLVIAVTALLMQVWAIGHAIGTPSAVFEKTQRSKNLWIATMVIFVPSH
jgi:fatty-acid desaturase